MAAKAATLALLGEGIPKDDIVEIPFPDGRRHGLKVNWISCGGYPQGTFASVIKDAGDDPDVTNGAEIIAKVVFTYPEADKRSVSSAHSSIHPSIVIKGGKGVGKVTRPGLPVPIGESAINPGPRAMISEAVGEALLAAQRSITSAAGRSRGDHLGAGG